MLYATKSMVYFYAAATNHAILGIMLSRNSWISTCVTNKTKPVTDMAILTQLMTSTVALLADSDPSIRTASADCAITIVLAAKSITKNNTGE
jgi:hypothetical protein